MFGRCTYIYVAYRRHFRELAWRNKGVTGILLIGGGGHCRAVIDVLESAQLGVAGVVHGDDSTLDPVLGYSALGRYADLPHLREKFHTALVAAGHIQSAAVRRRLFAALYAAAFNVPTIISPLAWVSPHAVVKEGTIVMHHAIVNAGAKVGRNGIINTKALVEHDCIVGDHCHIAVGALLCGSVCVDEGTFIGAGAVIKQGVHIGSYSVVGMGCVVRHDVPGGRVYVG